MPKKSSKKAKASRENGSKSKGPKTTEGKNAVRFNALKDALFTKELIVESAGERKEDFERLKQELWNHIEPENPLEEMLVSDVVENRWRLQRVRLAESKDLEKRLGFIEVSNLSPSDLSISEAIQSLQAQFLSCHEKYVLLVTSQRQMEALEMADQLEEIRRQLASTTGGLQFLLDQLKALQEEAVANGYIS